MVVHFKTLLLASLILCIGREIDVAQCGVEDFVIDMRGVRACIFTAEHNIVAMMLDLTQLMSNVI